MELNRHSIERKDFRKVRRGYDPEQVERHLRELADACTEQSREDAAGQALSSAVLGKLKTILDAAERSALEIQEGAAYEAKRVTSDSTSRARETLAQADAEARSRVRKLEDARETMVEYADEILKLAEGLHDGANHLRARLENVELGGLPVSTHRQAGATPEPAVRLVVTNLAMQGIPREETADYLRENFELTVEDEMLDAVYAQVSTVEQVHAPPKDSRRPRWPLRRPTNGR